MKDYTLAMVAASTAVAAQTVPTVHIPLNFYSGPNHKVSTNIRTPGSNSTIEVVFDTGSENFFMFGPDSVDNWGSSFIGSRGPCNVSVPAGSYYDYPASATASAPVDHPATYVYGGADKIYLGVSTVNDTFDFTSQAASRSETVADVRVEIVNLLTQRINDPTCLSAPLYDFGIMGISPYYNQSTVGPHIRQDLLERGAIGAAVQSMWFDAPPADVMGTYTGSGLFGGIDTSKYTGELVKVANTAQPGAIGYYVATPSVSVGGVPLSGNGSSVIDPSCQLDSGTHDDTLPVPSAMEAAFYAATGIVYSPSGYLSYNGSCASIPADKTIDLTFPGATAGEQAVVKIPLRAYARIAFSAADTAAGYCSLSLSTNGCFLGAPFSTAAFFAADDENAEVALAQGGVSAVGSGVDEASVVQRIP